jgi:hypothetical protein
MWSSWIKEKGRTQVMYIAKLRDGPKRVKKIFSMILETVLKMVWWREIKWNHVKKSFEVEVFFSSQNNDFPFYLKRPLDLFFHALCLEDLGGFMTFEEKITSSKTSFQIATIYWRWTNILEWSYARQHG